MRTTILALGLAILASTFCLSAQSLVDNEYYRRSLEFAASAQEAFEAGDYDAAALFAAQAKENAELSDRYVDKMVAKAAADRAIGEATERLAWALGVGAPKRFPTEYQAAELELEGASASYASEEYGDAEARARAAIDALALVSESAPLPATYSVRLIQERRDCLWRIAEYPFVYGDPLKWTLLYEANKKSFRDPTDPDLIYPGQVLKIPSVAGEERDGAYDPSLPYAPLAK